MISHKLPGTRGWFVIHHIGCGMQLFTDERSGDLLAGSPKTARLDRHGWHNPASRGPAAGQGSVPQSRRNTCATSSRRP